MSLPSPHATDSLGRNSLLYSYCRNRSTIILLLLVFQPHCFFKPQTRTQSQQHPVSVIICARDEDENLARNLPGVLVQSYPSSSEVVVVNDNSLDDSKYILQELKKTFKSLNVVELTQEAKLIPGKNILYPLASVKQNMKCCY